MGFWGVILAENIKMNKHLPVMTFLNALGSCSSSVSVSVVPYEIKNCSPFVFFNVVKLKQPLQSMLALDMQQESGRLCKSGGAQKNLGTDVRLEILTTTQEQNHRRTKYQA